MARDMVNNMKIAKDSSDQILYLCNLHLVNINRLMGRDYYSLFIIF